MSTHYIARVCPAVDAGTPTRDGTPSVVIGGVLLTRRFLERLHEARIYVFGIEVS